MAKAKAVQLTAYCMKTKEKNVPLQNAVIDRNGNRYIAKGDDGNGNKMCAILGAEKAEEAIEAGIAKRGAGWETPKKKGK